MKRKGLWNALFVFLCIVLTCLLGCMLIWGMKKDSKERERLEQLAVETGKPEKAEKSEEKEEIGTGQKKEELEKASTAILCFGNEMLAGAGNSYQAVLQKTLQEQGYTNPMISIAEAENKEQIEKTLKQVSKDSIPVICVGYEKNWNGDVQALIKRQEEVLASFQNQEQYIIVGVRPQDDSIRTAALDPAMEAKWGEHYISASLVTGTYVAASAEGQEAVAQAVFEKLVGLGYIEK